MTGQELFDHMCQNDVPTSYPSPSEAMEMYLAVIPIVRNQTETWKDSPEGERVLDHLDHLWWSMTADQVAEVRARRAKEKALEP